MTPEAAILAKAAALGAALPAFSQADAPELFASWSDRLALVDSLRHAGKSYAAALDECDRQLGIPASRVRACLPMVPTDGLWLERRAGLFLSDAAVAS